MYYNTAKEGVSTGLICEEELVKAAGATCGYSWNSKRRAIQVSPDVLLLPSPGLMTIMETMFTRAPIVSAR